MTLRECPDQIKRSCGRGVTTFLQSFVPGLGLVEFENVGVTSGKIIEETHGVGMVSNHQPVQRSAKLYRLTARGHHLFAAGEPVSVIQAQPCAKKTSIHRQSSVQMCITPKNLVGEIPLGIG